MTFALPTICTMLVARELPHAAVPGRL